MTATTMLTAVTLLQFASASLNCCIGRFDNQSCEVHTVATKCVQDADTCGKCGGVLINSTDSQNFSCGMGLSGIVTSFSFEKVPEYVIPITFPSTARRRLMGFIDFDPIGGTKEMLGFPDERPSSVIPFGLGDLGRDFLFVSSNEAADISEEVVELAELSSGVSRGVVDTALLAQKEATLRVVSDRLLLNAILSVGQVVTDITTSITSGFGAIVKSIITLTAGLSIARQEAIFMNELSNQREIYRIVQASEATQKIVELSTLSAFDSNIHVPLDTEYTHFYVTTWMNNWVKNQPISPILSARVGFQSFGLLSRVEVRRGRSPLSYVALGDNDVYRFKVIPILIGQNPYLRQTCNDTLVNCISDFIYSCRNNPDCYSKNDATTRLYGQRVEHLGRSIPFGDEFSTFDGELNKECGGSESPTVCISRPDETYGNVTYSKCGLNEVCDVLSDIVGARLSTIWLPCNKSYNFLRSMEELGGFSMPLVFPITASWLQTEENDTRALCPYAADFVDPITISKYLFTARNDSKLTGKAKELFELGSGKRNLVLAEYGETITISLGVQDNKIVISNETYYMASDEIKDMIQGNRPLKGYVPHNGCRKTNKTICCSNLASSSKSLQLPVLGRLINEEIPFEYRPTTLKEDMRQIQTIINSSVLAGTNLANMTNTLNITIQGLDLIENLTNDLIADLGSVVASQEGIQSQIQIEINDIRKKVAENENAINYSNSVGWTSVIVIGIIALLGTGICIWCVSKGDLKKPVVNNIVA